jgi:peptide/nickel transport system permease protein
MLIYFLRRVALGLAIMAVVIFFLFTMLHIIPGDPSVVALGQHATLAMRAAFRASMGLDLPLPIQYFRFLGHVLTGDLGTDIWSGQKVSAVVLQVLPNTIILAITSLFWSVLLGVVLGCIAALRRGRAADWLIGLLSVGLVGVPSFLVALFLLLVFAVHLNWLPAIGAGEPGNLSSQIQALILPSLAVGLGWVGYTARMVRGAMLSALQESYIRTFRAFGIAEWRIVSVHALRQAMLAIVPVIATGFGGLLSGAVFAEIVFARPGIGALTYEAVSTRNFPIVMGAALVTTALYITAMIAADMLVAWLDPRVREAL